MKTLNARLKSGVVWIVATLLLSAGCTDRDKGPAVSLPLKVTVMEVGSDSGQYGKEYSGVVASSYISEISFTVGGTVTELYAKEGQSVSKGQILGKVRNGDYQNAYNIARAQLEEAQDAYNRLKKLHDANALPEIKWVEVQQKLKEAQNSEEIAKRTLENATLHSPVSGTISKKYADVGQTVVPAEPVYEITSMQDITVNISVGENEIGSFREGEKAEITISSIPDSVMTGIVSEKGVSADPLTRTFTVKIKIEGHKTGVLPGMTATVRFDGKREDSGVIVLPPQAVVLNDDNRWFVWVVNDSIVEKRFVESNGLTNSGVGISSGLQPGDQVIVEGIRKIGTGSKVIPVKK